MDYLRIDFAQLPFEIYKLRVKKMIIQLQENLSCFNELFCGKQYDDCFGCSSKFEWNEEVERWLAFIKQKSKELKDQKSKKKEFYEKNKNMVKKAKQRDELLGEYKAAYFIEKKQNGKILEFEPKGVDGHKLDFLFRDIDGKEWFAEVKSPSWRNEVAKKVEGKCLEDLRAKIISYGLIKHDNKYKGKFGIHCPVCKISIEFISEKLDSNGFIVNEKIKNIKCPKCKNTLWNLLESKRAKQRKSLFNQPPKNGWHSIKDFIYDAIKKSSEQFVPGNNNILIITPNMFSDDEVGVSCLFNSETILKMEKNIDKQKMISNTISRICVLKVNHLLPNNEFEYEYNFINF